MSSVVGWLLRAIGVLAMGYAEIVTLVWVFNEHGLVWAVVALIFLPSVLVLSFIANPWYGVALVLGLGTYSVGRYLLKGYWESDEDHKQRLEAEAWSSRLEDKA